MKTSVTVSCLILGLTLTANFAGAQQSSTTTTTTTTTYVPTSTVVGARVVGSQGDEVGQISDVVLDKQSGCMAYVVLSTDQGGTRRSVAAPWNIFTAGSDNRTYTVTVDRQKIYSAPVWESSHIDEYNRAEWIGNVYSYYGVQPQSGLNIHANVGVNTEQRSEMNMNTRVRQTDRAVDRTRQDTEASRAERNADMLTQPSPGRQTRQSTESQMDRTRTDDQAQRQERRDRQQQRAERRASNNDLRAEESGSRRTEGQTERRATDRSEAADTSAPSETRQSRSEESTRPNDADRAHGQPEAADTPERSQQRQTRSERPAQSGNMDQNDRNMDQNHGDMNQNRPDASSTRPQHETNVPQSRDVENKARSRSREDQQSKHSETQASPTP